MIKKEIIDSISSTNLWGKKQDIGTERNVLKELDRLITKDIILSITGIRRCGKTYLTKQILSNEIEKGIANGQTLYVNFEDPSFELYLNTTLLDDIYETYRYYLNKEEMAFIVLDEIQNVPKWEKWVRMMLEKKENVKLIITGSSSKLLSSELSTVLTGRTITFTLYPLSFKEFIKFKNFKGFLNEKKALTLLEEYIEFGGFPQVVLNDSRDFKTRYLKEIFEGILTRDIVKRYKIKQEHTLRSLAMLLLNNFSSLVSVNKLKNLMFNITKRKLSPTTVNNYLKYFSDPFLFFFIPIFSYKIKDQIQYPKKAYCIDTGLINKVPYKFSHDKGKLYENIVAIELMKDNEIFYWKNPQQEEVDFVVKQGIKIKQLIQVCYDIKNKETKKRELRALLKASEELKCRNLLVITEDKEGEEKIKGKKIKFIPLWRWLLEKD